MVTFAYDLVGNLTSAQDADSDLSFQYDALGRMTRADTAATAAQISSTITHFYDRNGNRTNSNFAKAGNAFSLLYIHDALNRLTTLGSGGAFGPVTFTYDALSRRTSMTLSNGAVATYTYDAASQLTSVIHNLSGSPIASFNYTYDAVGNRTTLTDLDGINDYAYDPLNRLMQATHPQATNPPETFSYDPVGNRLSSQLATGQVHDAANRLLEDSTFTYAYDANGNLVEKIGKGTGDRTVYTYDAENQLIGVDQFTVAGGANPVLVADYSYDALGRRIEKNVNGVITRYLYDNEDIIFEVDGTGATHAVYLHGPGIDEPLAGTLRGEIGFNRFIYHADGLGSISTLTDLNGVPAQTYTYDSFGQIVDQTGSVPNPYTFTAREFDPETGLYYYRARYYDPTTGQFLQEDPVSGILHNPNTLNKYPYVLNNPTNLADPNGQIPPQVALALSGAVLGGISGAFGAIAQGGTVTQVVQAALLGAAVGAVAGALNPSALVGAFLNFGANVTGQFIGGGSLSSLNATSAAAALLGGGLGTGFARTVAGSVGEGISFQIVGQIASTQVSAPINAVLGLLAKQIPVTPKDLRDLIDLLDVRGFLELPPGQLAPAGCIL